MLSKRFINPITELAEQGKLSGLLLFCATFTSLSLSNIWLQKSYVTFWEQHLIIANFSFSVAGVINDVLMVIFFFLVGMEIKRELLIGELSKPRKAMLPVIAAIGGMLMPGLIYALINSNNTSLLNGWAIPTATDIAFSLGILSLLGSRVPFALKIFLTALAIIDDLGAIIIIALFYTEKIAADFLFAGVAIFILLIVLNKLKRFNAFAWLLLGIALWFCILKSGVHATVAGVLIALTIPLENLSAFEHALQKPVNYFILPVFALANTAIIISFENISGIVSSSGLGIITGLIIGKPVGIFLATFFSVKSKLCNLPSGISFKLILGVGFTAGIGFTMSLFIATLSFNNVMHLETAKLAVITGSVFSAIAGIFFLKYVTKVK